MTANHDEYWRATPQMPSEAPPDWVNRDYDESAPAPSRRWMVWTVMILSAAFAITGLWSSIEPLLR